MAIPQDQRPAAFALRAFNIETSLIADQVRSKEFPLLALRYQWWRDAINNTYKGKPPDHPVTLAIASLLETRLLPRYMFMKVIDAREDDSVTKAPPASVKELVSYSQATAGQVLLLKLAAAGADVEVVKDAALHLGAAVGIANLLRGAVYHAQRGRTYLPRDVCDAQGAHTEDILRGEMTPELKAAARAVADVARDHLRQAQQLRSTVPAHARGVLLQSVAADSYLTALRRADGDLLQPHLATAAASPIKHVLCVKYRMLTKTY